MSDGLRKTAKSPIWQYRFTIDGCRYERSTGETSRSKARAKRALIEMQIRAEIEQKRALQNWQDMPFSHALTAYIHHDPKRDLRFLDKLLAYFGETKLGAINNQAMAHAAHALYPDRASSTVRRQLFVPVNAIINYAKDDKLRAPKGGEVRTHWLWPSEVDRLVLQLAAQPNPWLPAMALFLVGQGTRVGETLAIDARRDVSLEHGWCMVRDTKNDHERRLVLQPKVIAAISRLPNINQPGPLFRRIDGSPYKKRTGRGGQIRNPFAYAVAAAGLDKRTTPHVLRHTWASWFSAQTKDVMLLKEQGGWKSDEWERYTKLAPISLLADLDTFGWNFALAGENWGNWSNTDYVERTKSTA